ncbi:ABC transporter ATP-binding protein [Kytococcus sedentarius]|uniref:ABC transporter ATP-binding protein n=1 Tax=Kytococcus sedentarius TaxID=1276 RepID=UPI0019525C86|nr:ABC transporter ATP-binding protein [Kytococcus sedentarius]QRO86960.1 ABC transporter ATP-binding protein [Kytococcus sedentarius]
MDGVVIDALGIHYGETVVVEGFSLRVEPGECLALMGPSGSGKSSILSCLVGMQKPTSGTVTVAGREVSSLNSGQRARVRRELIGVTYQSPGLLPELSIEENVAVTLLFDGTPRGAALEKARESLAQVGLSGHEGKRVDEISGGQAQRVAIARALVRDSARVLVADEPTASLDQDNAREIALLLTQRIRSRQLAGVLATHDPLVADLFDRTVDLRDATA